MISAFKTIPATDSVFKYMSQLDYTYHAITKNLGNILLFH